MNGLNLDKVTISAHAKQRYAERIMDRNRFSDAAQFVAQHDVKIKADIRKMVEFGKLVYSGKSFNMNNRRRSDIYVNGTWIVILDSETWNVITLYNIDLGLDEEFTRQYVDKMLEKLEGACVRLKEADQEIEEQRGTYTTLIAENEENIREYNKIVESLTEQNRNYRGIVANLKVKHDIADKEVRDTVAVLIGKKVF